MDIRDVKDEVPFEVVTKGNVLEEIFTMQKNLLDRYIGIEVIPKYPIDIDSKEHQVLIKDFIARIVEELSEGFESYTEMILLWEGNAEKRKEQEEEEDLIPFLQNFNEELGDALHFFVEVFIYCNISAGDILNYYDLMLKEKNLQDVYYFKTNILGTCMAYGRHCNIEEGLYRNPRFSAPKVIADRDLKDEFLRGGRKISPDNMEQQMIHLWRITYHLNLARNMLKNKPWKQTEMMTDENRFQRQIMESWLHFISYLDFIEMTEESIFTIYFKKNRINHFRLDSKY